jgi:choice-of-anchor C domain-containing protein
MPYETSSHRGWLLVGHGRTVLRDSPTLSSFIDGKNHKHSGSKKLEANNLFDMHGRKGEKINKIGCSFFATVTERINMYPCSEFGGGNMKRFMVVAVLAGTMCIVTAGAQGASFTNGSFEQGAFDPGAYTTLYAVDTSLVGWAAYKGSIDWVGSYWTPADGNRSLDLNGASPGGIAQSFTTVAGQAYKVTFNLAGNPDNGPAVKTLYLGTKNVYTNSILYDSNLSFDTTGKTKSSMGWATHTFEFVAASNLTSLWFESTTNSPTFNFPDFGVVDTNPFGPALDSVRVDAVPISGTLILFGSGLLGLVGIGRRRFRK